MGQANGLDVILCDQNYQFDELAQLAPGGPGDRTLRLGALHRGHLAPAREAYDVVYSVTLAEQSYRGWGLETPRVPWGIHPGCSRWSPGESTTASSASSSRAASSATASPPSR